MIDNPNSNAISRTSGHIISEAENNIVKWNIDSNSSNYIVPFGYDTADYLPISFTPMGAVGNGSFILSTYHTGSAMNSSYLPTGISSYNFFGNDHSLQGLDRFWQVNPIGYTTKPSINNLQLSYRDAEHNLAPNTISENNLMAKRWNSLLNQWDDFSPNSIVNTATNMVTIPSISNSQHFAWWSLVSFSTPLPIDLLSFTGSCKGSENVLNWTSATERNNDYFVVQRSIDAIHFETLKIVKTKANQGNSSSLLQYEAVDNNPTSLITYYRLQQVDIDGKTQYSNVVVLTRETITGDLIAYPNPSQGSFIVSMNDENIENASLMIQDMKGSIVHKQFISQSKTFIQLNQKPGTYLMSVVGRNSTRTLKIIIQ